jgi:Ca-activated chloride channel family protein
VDWGVKGVESYPARIPDLFAGQPMWVTAKVPAGATSVTVKGRLGNGTYSKTLPIVDGGDGNALATLFARSRIATLERQLHWGQDDEVQKRILDTALQYRIMSKYTSFVAIDHKIINPNGEMRHVDQPVDIPDGVEYESAVSREWTPPGDPLLTVDAPADARSVVAFYPWGQTALLRWDPLRKRYYHRFLVPREMADGDLTVRLSITLADGRIERRNQVIHVDGAVPEIDVALTRTGEATTVTIRPNEPLRSVVVQPKGRPDLRRRVDFVQDLAEVSVVLPGVWAEVEVDAKDRAMNTITTVAR